MYFFFQFCPLFLNLQICLRITGISLDRPSQLGHIRTTLTWFNFKLGLGKKSSREVSRLTLRTMFNNNTKEFLVT